MYKLQITKTEANPNYEVLLKEYKERNRYNSGSFDNDDPRPELIKNLLVVELTDEQYKKVKAEVFKVFE